MLAAAAEGSDDRRYNIVLKSPNDLRADEVKTTLSLSEDLSVKDAPSPILLNSMLARHMSIIGSASKLMSSCSAWIALELEIENAIALQ